MSIESTIPITKALDGLFLRQMVTAQNIANANSAGYVPLRVSFEDVLSQTVQHLQSNPEDGVSFLKSLEPQIRPDSNFLAGDAMRLDLELQTVAQTSMRYAALLNVLDRGLQLQSLAHTGGR